MVPLARRVRLDGAAVSLVFDLAGAGPPRLLYIGPRLAPTEDLDMLAAAHGAIRRGSQPDRPVPPGIFPEAGRGHQATPAIELSRKGCAVPTAFELVEISSAPCKVSFVLRDSQLAAAVELEWTLTDADVIAARAKLRNEGDEPLGVNRLAALTIDLPDWVTQLDNRYGRWAGEGQCETIDLPRGSLVRISRAGRPDFEGGNWLVLHEHCFAPDAGRGIAAHLAWSGDHHNVVDNPTTDFCQLQLGPRLDPGEIVLEPEGIYETPIAYFAFSESGSNGLAASFHRLVRAIGAPASGVRRVHLNTWEAVAFDMDEQRLLTLAEEAAAIGVERFVVDDGWFAGRRDATTSLGDWSVDEWRFPRGLDALIARVGSLGMDFGLWVEPEMVSPTSRLFACHPDWCLGSGGDMPTQRAQLVLDLSRSEVGDYLYSCLSDLLARHPIMYLKWDHNRALFPLIGHSGPAVSAQTLALYALLDRLRARFPGVDIESCASGGARIDCEIVRRCHRVWPSDNNDPFERLRIVSAMSRFLPLEWLGNHVGPRVNPITGRETPMPLRAKVALFGHMGVEADPGAMSIDERQVLACHVAVYKKWRDILHGGSMNLIETVDPSVTAFAAIAPDRRRALALAARADFARGADPFVLRIAGLSLDSLYRVRAVLPDPGATTLLVDRSIVGEGLRLTGRGLAHAGIALPLTTPGTAWLIECEEEQ